MYKKIFFDTNIIVDLYDTGRATHRQSSESYIYILSEGISLYTSCDIITTIYYILSKHDKKVALSQIEDINQTLDVVAFGNKEVEATCRLMRKDSDYTDLEDTIQVILAQKAGCDLIISNDKKFVSKEIEVMSSPVFHERYVAKRC